MPAVWKKFFLLSLALTAVAVALYFCVRPDVPAEMEDTTLPALSPGEERLPLPPLKRAGQAAAPQMDAFRRLAADTLSRLPTHEAFAANPNRETHFTPSELLDAAPLMARLTTELRQNPAFIPDGIAFYEACARNEALMTATRAVCLRDLRHWTQQHPGAAAVDPSQFEPTLWDIASYLSPRPY